jgi:methylated-DNA-protein-cysteine methyltransferase-like protein
MIMKRDNLYQKIYDLVGSIPFGKVATYGQIARCAGMPQDARRVAYALHVLPQGTQIPWHRVINRQGKISYALSRNGSDALQQVLLEKEGIHFSRGGIIDMEQYLHHFE